MREVRRLGSECSSKRDRPLIEDWLAGGRRDVARLSRTSGISRETGRKPVERFLERGLAGLADRLAHVPGLPKGAVRWRWRVGSVAHRPSKPPWRLLECQPPAWIIQGARMPPQFHPFVEITLDFQHGRS